MSESKSETKLVTTLLHYGYFINCDRFMFLSQIYRCRSLLAIQIMEVGSADWNIRILKSWLSQKAFLFYSFVVETMFSNRIVTLWIEYIQEADRNDLSELLNNPESLVALKYMITEFPMSELCIWEFKFEWQWIFGQQYH